MNEHEYSFDEGVEDESIPKDTIFKEYMLKEVPDAFKDFKLNGSLWHYGFDGCFPAVYYTILDILQTHKFDLETIDIGSEGGNQLIYLRHDKINNIFLTEALRQLEVKGANEDVKKD